MAVNNIFHVIIVKEGSLLKPWHNWNDLFTTFTTPIDCFGNLKLEGWWGGAGRSANSITLHLAVAMFKQNTNQLQITQNYTWLKIFLYINTKQSQYLHLCYICTCSQWSALSTLIETVSISSSRPDACVDPAMLCAWDTSFWGNIQLVETASNR